jgi:hypothetical protein
MKTILVSILALIAACGNAKAPKFEGAFVTRGLVNWAAFVFEPDGTAKYVYEYTTDDLKGSAVGVKKGVYAVSLDTATINIPDPNGELNNLRVMLRKDTLVFIDSFWGTWIKGKIPESGS